MYNYVKKITTPRNRKLKKKIIPCTLAFAESSIPSLASCFVFILGTINTAGLETNWLPKMTKIKQ